MGAETRTRSCPGGLARWAPAVGCAPTSTESALATPVGLATYSVLTNVNLLGARNLIASLPAGLCLIAVALAARPRRLAAALAAVALLTFGFATVQALQPEYQRPQLRQAATLIQTTAPANAVVVVRRHSRLAVYLRTKHTMRALDAVERAWREASARHAALALAIQIDFPRPLSRLAWRAPPPRYRRSYRVACEQVFTGLFPLDVRIFVPNTNRTPFPANCRRPVVIESRPTRDWRDANILATSNGRGFLPQDRPFTFTDGLVPLAAFSAAVLALGATVIRRTRSRRRPRAAAR